MSSYTNVFGGNNIDPSQLSFKAYSISTPLVLQWPFEALDGSNIAAAKLDIAASIASLDVFLPDARNASVGQDILIKNVGANAFTVRDSDGNTIISIAPGLAWFIYLTDNTTTAGTWDKVQFGAGTSSADAASLAGSGLRANVSQLDQNLVTDVYNAGHLFAPGDRARVARNNGGVVAYTFNSAVTLGNGWFVYIINGGTGVVTLTPNGVETIDGAPSKTVQPSESLIVFSDGSNLWTLGYGRAVTSTVTGAAINIAGTGSYTLSSTQAVAQVQDFSGALTGARTVLYGTGVGYWLVYNNTTGAFATTFKTNVIDPGVVVAQGSYSILRSNGTNMEIAFTATSGTVTQVNTAAGELTGGPITGTGTIGLANTAVVAGVYGGPGTLVGFQVDAKGRLVGVATGQLNIADSAPCTSAQLAAVITNETGTGPLVFGTGPSISDANLTGDPAVPTPPVQTNGHSPSSTAWVNSTIAAAIAAISTVGFSTGDILHTLLSTERSGFVFLNGRTLGSAGSGATLNGVTYQPLYEFFWNNYSNTLCPVSTGRGASAAADFAANKTLTMLDARGTVLAAAEDMGGASRGNLGGNASTGGFSGTASLGQQAGQKAHAQVLGELAAHTHQFLGSNAGGGVTGGGNVLQASAYNSTLTEGGGAAANVTQPTLVCNVLVKL